MIALYELLVQGGAFVLPILLCSVVGVALFVERLLHLRRERIIPSKSLRSIENLLLDGDLEAAAQACEQSNSPIGRMLREGIRYAGRPRRLIRTVMEEAGGQEMSGLRRFTPALGAIATIAPLLGLLGTVVGMIKMFQGVVVSATQSASGPDVGQLAGGIWQALITTAAGLVVAIPVFLAHRYVLSRIDHLAGEMEQIGRRAMEYLVGPEERPTLDDGAPGEGEG